MCRPSVSLIVWSSPHFSAGGKIGSVAGLRWSPTQGANATWLLIASKAFLASCCVDFTFKYHVVPAYVRLTRSIRQQI